MHALWVPVQGQLADPALILRLPEHYKSVFKSHGCPVRGTETASKRLSQKTLLDT